MAGFEDEWSGSEGEIEYEQDDKLLCDLHLNSALNIDFLRVTMGQEVKYTCIPPQRIISSYNKGTKIVKDIYERNFTSKAPSFSTGAVRSKVRHTRCSEIMEPWKDNWLEHTIGELDTCFAERGFTMAFKRAQQCLKDKHVILPVGLLGSFTKVMNLCLSVSETLRGGSIPRLFSGSVLSEGKHLYTTLATAYGPGMIATDGTTVFHMWGDCIEVTIWEDLLALMDTLGQRICSFVVHSLARAVGEDGGIESEMHRILIEHFDDILEESGNTGYKLIGMFETLCTSVLLRNNPDNINDPLGLTTNLYTEVLEIIEESDLKRESVIEHFDSSYAIISNLDNCQISNLFCEYRLWGHPYVDVHEGMKKVHKIGTLQKTISPSLPLEMIRIFKEYIVTGIYKEKRKYPAGMIKERYMDCPDYIASCILKNKPVERYNQRYHLDSWDEIELPCLFDIPSTFDITHILNDKAISPKLCDIVKAVSQGVSLEMMEGRRGILSWLKGNTINCKSLLKSISKYGLSKDDLVIGMYEKEREMKIEARMFALMSENMRYYFVITEGLIADHLLKYFPQITMKDSLNKIQKRLWSAGTRGSGLFDINVNIDFSKWNTNMRSELMTPIFREMDKLFGLSDVISRTHEIFTNSWIYSCSGKYTPACDGNDLVEDGPMCYKGHLGGMEGLRQKGWTIGTVCLIDYVARYESIRYSLMGQGDNQIIKIKMNERFWDDLGWEKEKKAMEARIVGDNFVNRLEKIFGEVGLPVKPKECWRSHRLFMYGKSMVLDDKVISQWCKKILRSYALSNEGILTVNGTIGTISSNCMSSCTTMNYPELGYCAYLLLGAWTLRFLFKYHPFCRTERFLDKEIQFKIGGEKKIIPGPRISEKTGLYTILLFPSHASGAVNIPFTSYIMRGFPDPCSEAYSWISLLTESKDRDLSIIATNFYSYLRTQRINLDSLAQSPLSINHRKVLAPNLSAKEETKKYLRESFAGSNNVVMTQMKIEEAYKNVLLADKLRTTRMNPLVFSEIYSLFPGPVVDDLLSRVQTTRTIKKMALRVKGKPIIKRIQICELEFLGFLRWRSGQRGEIFSVCSTEHVRFMRDIGWGLEISGVSTPHPLEFSKATCRGSVECEELSDYVYVLKDERAPFAPYLGSVVKNKVSGVGDQNVRAEPIMKGIVRMATYANWINMGENLKTVIRELAKYYGGDQVMESIEKDLNAEGNHTGAVDHRFKTGTLAEGCFINYAPQVGAKIFMSTDMMSEYGRGNTNFTLQFQALFCWLQLMCQRTGFTHHCHVHISCKKCVIPVVDDLPDIPDCSGLILHQTSLLMNNLLGVTLSSTIGYQDNDSTLKEHLNSRIIQTSDTDPRTLRLSLTIVCGMKIAEELMLDSLEDNDAFTVGTEDLQRYPRIYGKKMFCDELLEFVSMFCIIIGSIKRESGLDGLNLFQTKRYVVDHLIHLPISRLNGLGSLTLEREIQDIEQYYKIDSNGASFPVSTVEHLLGQLATLRRNIQQIGSMEFFSLPKFVYVPHLDMTDYEYHLLACGLDVVKNNCGRLLDACSDKLDDKAILRTKCPNKHMGIVLKSIKPVNGSIDKMFKCLSGILVSEYEFPYNIPDFPLRILQDAMSCAEGPKRLRERRPPRRLSPYYDIREVSLPTGAVYKWTEVTQWKKTKLHNIILGDGTGTTSHILATANLDKNFFPMALFEHHNVTPQDMGAYSPPLSRGFKNIKLNAIMTIPDNVLSESFVPLLSNFVRQLGAENVCIFSDIEYLGGGILTTGILKDLLSMGAELVLKAYSTEIYKNDSLSLISINSCSCLFPFTGNSQYGEFFLHIIPGSGKFIDIPSIMRELDIFFEQDHHETAKSMTKVISSHVPYLRERSLNLALRHLDGLGFLFHKNNLLMTPSEIMMHLITYVNNHYIFMADQRDASGVRRLSPKKRERIERLYGILLLSTINGWIDLNVLAETKLMRFQDGYSHRYPMSKMFVRVKGNKTLLTKKDMQCVHVFKGMRERYQIGNRSISILTSSPSEEIHELMGFLSRTGLKEIIYRYSGTFDSGTTLNTTLL